MVLLEYDVKYLDHRRVIDELNPMILSGKFDLVDTRQLSPGIIEFVLDTELGRRYVYEYMVSSEGKYFILMVATKEMLEVNELESLIDHETRMLELAYGF